MNSLPVECRELILHHLRIANNQQALARVLTLNHAWLSLTLPILFADPFTDCPPKYLPALCRLLLRSILGLDPYPTHPRIRSDLACLLGPISCSNPHCKATHTTFTPTFAPYASHLTCFDPQPWDSFVSQVCGKTMCIMALHHLRSRLFYVIIDGSRFRQRSIQIPVDLLSCLIHLADHLPALTRLAVIGDWMCRTECETLIRIIHLHRSKFGASQIVHWQLPGVKSFRNTYGDLTASVTGQDYLNVLESIDQPVSIDMSSWESFSKVCLKLLDDPLSSTASSAKDGGWCDRLTEFRHDRGIPYVGGEFLRQCRALQHLTILVRNENDFDWAVQEKQRWTIPSTTTSMTPSAPITTTALATETAVERTRPSSFLMLSLPPTPLTTTPVKLKSLTLTVPYFLFARTVRSIAQGLNTYLQRWNVTVHYERELRELQPYPGKFDERDPTFVVFDHSWQFPDLQLWHIARATEKLVIGAGAFQPGAFPQLRDLSIWGTASCPTTSPAAPQPPSTSSPASPLSLLPTAPENSKTTYPPMSPRFETWHLPNLEHLKLGDGVAHLFNFETLRHAASRLRSLLLYEHVSRVVQEMVPFMPTTPRWDWTMSCLTTLHMTGRPSLYFRFTWLYSCPALEHLHIEGMRPSSYCCEAADHLLPAGVHEERAKDKAEGKRNDETEERGQGERRGKIRGTGKGHNAGGEARDGWSWDPVASKISTCYLQINTRKPIHTTHLKLMLRTFCRNVRRLVLKGSLDPHGEWGEMDVGSALDIAANQPGGLNKLERLVVNVGYRPTRVDEYGLVRASSEKGEVITDRNAKQECWPTTMGTNTELSSFVMEVFGMKIRVGVFRQILQRPCTCQQV